MHLKPASRLLSRALLTAVAGGLFCFAPVSAMAQWMWLDKDGRKVYSDQSPPPAIPEKSILKRPGMRNALPADAPAASAAPAVVPGNKPPAPQLTGKDPQLEAKKKQADDAESAKKKAEDDKLAQAKSDNCVRAKKSMGELQSGVRIATTNAKGEREIMDDGARAAEAKRVQAIMDSDCK